MQTPLLPPLNHLDYNAVLSAVLWRRSGLACWSCEVLSLQTWLPYAPRRTGVCGRDRSVCVVAVNAATCVVDRGALQLS